LGWWLRRNNDRDDPVGDLGAFLALWFVAAFGMFTITLTKFHHYIFPVVPPTAMLIGLLLDRAIDRAELPTGRQLAYYLAGMTGAVALMVYGVFRFFPGSLTGRTPGGAPPRPVVWLGCVSVGLGLALAMLVVKRFGRQQATEPPPSTPEPSTAEQYALEGSEPYRRTATAPPAPSGTATASMLDARTYDAVIIAAMAIASAIVLAAAGRDLFTTIKGDIEGQARLMQLFTYNYRRPWPGSLDFNGILTAFTIVPAALSLLIAVPKLRTHASVALLASAVLWAAWGTDVYLFKASPHWGQRETVLAYYVDRKSPNEPLVAYQMNWKGENFYTGNRTPAFVSSGQKFKDWIAEQQKKGVTTIYFTTEHGRVGSLKGEIGTHKTFDAITTPELNNKFFIGRARF
jgi:hypothetical protein